MDDFQHGTQPDRSWAGLECPTMSYAFRAVLPHPQHLGHLGHLANRGLSRQTHGNE